MSMSRIGIAEVAKQGQNHPTFLLSTGKGDRYIPRSRPALGITQLSRQYCDWHQDASAKITSTERGLRDH